MKFDIQPDRDAVQHFVQMTIEQFHGQSGKASIIRFDVQAVHGQIHAYPSTHHTPVTIHEDIGKPLEFIFDCDPWSDHRHAGDTPDYQGLPFDSEEGDGAFNDYFAVMVYDAVVAALREVPPEQRPKHVMVESALESGGVFHRLIQVEQQTGDGLAQEVDFTDFIFLNSSGAFEIEVDTFGGIVAFDCYECLHPVIASEADNERGSDEEHPSFCKGCGMPYFLDIRYHAKKMYIHTLGSVDSDDP